MTTTEPPSSPHAAHSIVIEAATKRFTLRHARSIREISIRALRRRPLSDTFNAVDGVDLTVDTGSTVALLGLNGSGKSTLLKLISGVMTPDSGRVRVRGRVAGLIDVGAGLHPELTGRENVYLNGAILGMGKEEIERKFDAIVDFAETEAFLDTPVKFYSAGMFMRLGFSIAVHTEPDVFLIDEVMAVGDPLFRRKCRQKLMELRHGGLTMVIVAHDLPLLRDLCRRGIVLSEGRVVFDGPMEQAADLLLEQRRNRQLRTAGSRLAAQPTQPTTST
ncbi:ABC transporter ATP-binding protein [Actinomadura sp. SCN-SB]|uniref:ABC transporter ATP-binding protein n=1 Tax=Actinomadura sp. SCN-SB TaxID=3373092 RepID=UPI00374FF0EE